MNEPSCPAPLPTGEVVLLGHGGGGRLTHQLLERMFLPALKNPALEARHDGAVLELCSAGAGARTRVAFTTDSYVVSPLFFPGGSIGDLAVNGTINDLAMCGARPIALSAAFIVEEGLPLQTLERALADLARAAAAVNVPVVTGDTKVVEKGKADGLFITTAGIGAVEHGGEIAPAAVRLGDAILLSGDLGRHGIAILTHRSGIALEGPVTSDTAPVWAPVEALIREGVDVHCLRDLTRGGLATALVEIARASGHELLLREESVPIAEAVRGACEILGLDPLYVANEGRFVAFVPEHEAARALAILRRHEVACGAALVGVVTGPGKPDARPAGRVVLRTRFGTERLVEMLSGEQLPRIC